MMKHAAPTRSSVRDLPGAMVAAVLMVLSAACVGVSGGIPPSQFRFTKVVKHQGAGSGGWKVAQVAILLYRGPVPDELAQTLAATAADTAARIVLKERITLSAALCLRFRQEMQRSLSSEEAIPGSRVTGFMTSGVPRTTFP